MVLSLDRVFVLIDLCGDGKPGDNTLSQLLRSSDMSEPPALWLAVAHTLVEKVHLLSMARSHIVTILIG